jgi:hypothetical protein
MQWKQEIVQEDRVSIRRTGLFVRFPERMDLADRGVPGVEHSCCTGRFQTGPKLYVHGKNTRTNITGSPLITPRPETLSQYYMHKKVHQGAVADVAFGWRLCWYVLRRRLLYTDVGPANPAKPLSARTLGQCRERYYIA